MGWGVLENSGNNQFGYEYVSDFGQQHDPMTGG